MSNLAKRLIFAFTAMPIVAFLMWFGDSTRIAFVLFLNAVAAWEWAKMVNAAYPGPSLSAISPLASLVFTLFWVFPMSQAYSLDAMALLGAALVSLVVFLYIALAFAKVDVALLFPWLVLQIAGPLYLGLWGGSTMLLFGAGQGWLACAPFLIVMTTMWACDSAAYFAGRFLGKRKMSPQISPKKTWAGAVGGTLFAMFWFMLWTGPVYPVFEFPAVWMALAFALVISVAGQMGDLLMSALKRWSGIKDSGSIFPGHGGVLDRADSFYLAAPLALVLLKALQFLG
jgi:phosphatidate cytidylyltransferase